MHIQEEHVRKFTFRKSGQVVNDTANREDICLGTDHCRWSQLRWTKSKIGDEGVLAHSLHEVKVYVDGLCRSKGLDEIQATDFNLSLLGDVDVFRGKIHVNSLGVGMEEVNAFHQLKYHAL